MNEYPVFDEDLDDDPIRNIIRNALNWQCFNDDTYPQTRCNTTEVTIYNGTILASPIIDVESLSECHHDFVALGRRSIIDSQNMGQIVFDSYRNFLNQNQDVKIEKDDVTLNNAFSDLRNAKSSLVAVNDDSSNRDLLPLLLSNQSQYPGTHFPPTSANITTPLNKNTSLAGLDNSASASKYSVFCSPTDVHPSCFLSPINNSQDSVETTLSKRNQVLDSMSSNDPEHLRKHLYANTFARAHDIDTSQNNMCNEIFGKVSISELPIQQTSTSSIPTSSIDHGCLNFKTTTDIFSNFNRIYDNGSGIDKTSKLKAVNMDNKLLSLSYVYYSRCPTDGEIRGLLICLEPADFSDKVFMKKYLFSCDKKYHNLTPRDVSDIAPNVASLCSEMNNGRLGAVDVALMKAAADRTLKIGALLFAVGLEKEKTCFITHEPKLFYYNKLRPIMNIDRILVDVYLFSVLTSQHNRGKNGGEPRRYTLVHQLQLQESTLQKLINYEFVLTNYCEKLNLDIQQIEIKCAQLGKLLGNIKVNLNKIIGENVRPQRSLTIHYDYNKIVEDYVQITGATSKKTFVETDSKKTIDEITEQYRKQYIVLEATFAEDYAETKSKLNELLESYNKCINEIEKTKLDIQIELVKTTDDLSQTQNQVKSPNEKGGIRKGGRRTRRSIKVITKRKIKVKSKTIKKKSRRKNKTRRQ